MVTYGRLHPRLDETSGRTGMSRPLRPWFRFYTETITDRKIMRLPPAQRWLWAAVLAAARESPEPGQLMVAGGVPMTTAELARYAGVRDRDVREGLAAMSQLGMISIDDGVIEVTNFKRRQFESDNVTARTRAHREQNRNVPKPFPGTASDVPGNDHRTPASRSRERSGNVIRADGRALATESETEKETKEKISSTDVDGEFEAFYAVYPRHVGRGQAIRAWRTAIKKADAGSIIAAARSFGESSAGGEERFIPHPASWLNGERWADGGASPELEHDPRPEWMR